MQDVKVTRGTAGISWRKYFPFVLILVLLVAALAAYNASNARQAASTSPAAAVLSPSALEAQYGLRVNLIAVTAAGGMVDFRLKIVDGKKARLLLQDKKNFPSLLAGGVTLSASEDAKAQEIRFEDDSNLFVLFSNSRNALKSGATVGVLFGKVRLEPIVVK